MSVFGRCELELSDGEQLIAFVEVTLDESSHGPQVAERTVSLEVRSTEQGDPFPDTAPAGSPKVAYESAALSGWFFALQRIRALRGDEELPSVRLATLRIAISQKGVSTEQIAGLAAAATYRALGGSIAEKCSKVPELP
jgi:hypothetical protein